MITTVTTTTVSSISDAGLVGLFGLITTLALVVLLISKEIAVSAPGDHNIRWGRVLNVGIIPLLFSFAMIVTVRFAQAF